MTGSAAEDLDAGAIVGLLAAAFLLGATSVDAVVERAGGECWRRGGSVP